MLLRSTFFLDFARILCDVPTVRRPATSRSYAKTGVSFNNCLRRINSLDIDETVARDAPLASYTEDQVDFLPRRYAAINRGL